MTKNENKQRIKNEALNNIRRLFHPLYKHNYTFYPGEGSLTEQRDGDVSQIIENMNKDIEKLNK